MTAVRSERQDRASEAEIRLAGYCLEDLSVGQSAECRYVITPAAVEAFAAVSGDTNPLHLDDAYALSTPFKGRIAHGLLIGAYVSAVLGTVLPGPGAIYVSQSLDFRRPARIGAEVTVKVTIMAIDALKAHVTLSTICKAAGKVVVAGEAVVLVSRRDA